MDWNSILSWGVRILAVLLGLFFVVQGVVTAGFVAIVGLFAETTGQLLHTFALVLLGVGMVLFGVFLVHGGVRNFPYVGPRVRRALFE